MRNLLTALIIAAGAASMLPFAPTPAAAGIEYPWCAQYGGGRQGGGTNCGFETHKQCMDTISGIGGICYENPRYVPPAPRKTHPRH